MNDNHPLASFNPWKLARYEKENYVAYYQRRWLKLLRASVGMVRESFHLSLPQAVYGAFLVARAELAFAPPEPRNNLAQAEVYARKFYAFIQGVHHLSYDIDRAAQLEVKWWGVHRKLFAQAKNEELVDALTYSAAELFQVDPTILQPAMSHRAQGMLLSDLWVRSGMDPNSPLLVQEEAELAQGYILLREALLA
jgi:hypothetical protein